MQGPTLQARLLVYSQLFRKPPGRWDSLVTKLFGESYSNLDGSFCDIIWL